MTKYRIMHRRNEGAECSYYSLEKRFLWFFWFQICWAMKYETVEQIFKELRYNHRFDYVVKEY